MVNEEGVVLLRDVVCCGCGYMGDCYAYMLPTTGEPDGETLQWIGGHTCPT